MKVFKMMTVEQQNNEVQKCLLNNPQVSPKNGRKNKNTTKPILQGKF